MKKEIETIDVLVRKLVLVCLKIELLKKAMYEEKVKRGFPWYLRN